jgi:hypothetical protein
MGGGLMQLVAYGAQDVYLTGNPQITFFKIVYRRHTGFAMECIEQTFNGMADWGKKVTCTISRNGDLINRMYLRVELPTVNIPEGYAFRYLDWIGHILIKTVEVEIGGQRIDKHYGDWLHIWNELTQTAGHALGYAHMVGNVPRLTNLKRHGILAGDPKQNICEGEVLYIPLQFWFCRSIGLSLPLIALQYHEVKINIELREAKDCCFFAKYESNTDDEALRDSDITWPIGSLNASLYVDYMYLDTDERRRFAQLSHEYLIEQLQFTGDESTSQQPNKLKLNFNHPVKFLTWVVQPDDHIAGPVKDPLGNSLKYVAYQHGKQWFNYTDHEDMSMLPNVLSLVPGASGGMANGGSVNTFVTSYFGHGDNPTDTARLQLNGHDRMAERCGKYYNCVQPYQHFENVPSQGICTYSFALRPIDHQPSGTCNFSRIDNATLNLNLTPQSVKSTDGNGSRSCKVRVYSVNYNVLRIMSGMGGLAYAN